MGLMILTVRFVPLLCVLVTCPAVGQVENALDERSPDVALADAQRAPVGQPSPSSSIQPPRLQTSEMALAEGPRGGLAIPMAQPQLSVRPQLVQLATPLGARQEAAPQTAAPAPLPLQAQTSAYDRIAALSAVPLQQAPGEAGGPRQSRLASAMNGVEAALETMRPYGRQIGLVSALALTAGLLLWRLGERSRHSEQELVLGIAGWGGPIDENEKLAFDSLPEPDAREAEMAAPAIRRPMTIAQFTPDEELLLDTDVLGGPQIKCLAQHATLREALEAMKLDRAARATVDA